MQKFNVFDPVLIRVDRATRWTADFYDHPASGDKGHICITGVFIKNENILPYNEETKHLHGTVGEFVKWEPKKGEPILVKDNEDTHWTLRIFLGMRGDRYICTGDPTITYSQAPCAGWDCAKPYTNPFEE